MRLIDANGERIESGARIRSLHGRTYRRIIATENGGAWGAWADGKTARFYDAETLALFWVVCDD